VTEVAADVVHPQHVFSDDIVANGLGLAAPVLDVLSEEAHLRSHGWDSKRSHHVVVGVSAHLVADDFVGVALEGTVGEWGVLIDVLEDCQVARRPRLDVIGSTAIEGPHELVAGGMAVDDELYLVLALCHKVSEGSALRLREGLLSWPVVTAQVGIVGGVERRPVDSVVSIEVCARVLCTTRAQVHRIHVLPFVQDFVLGEPVLLHECGAVDVDDWDEVIDVGGKQLLVVSHILNVGLMKQLKACVERHLGGEKLAGVRGSSDQEGVGLGAWLWWPFGAVIDLLESRLICCLIIC